MISGIGKEYEKLVDNGRTFEKYIGQFYCVNYEQAIDLYEMSSNVFEFRKIVTELFSIRFLLWNGMKVNCKLTEKLNEEKKKKNVNLEVVSEVIGLDESEVIYLTCSSCDIQVNLNFFRNYVRFLLQRYGENKNLKQFSHSFTLILNDWKRKYNLIRIFQHYDSCLVKKRENGFQFLFYVSNIIYWSSICEDKKKNDVSPFLQHQQHHSSSKIINENLKNLINFRFCHLLRYLSILIYSNENIQMKSIEYNHFIKLQRELIDENYELFSSILNGFLLHLIDTRIFTVRQLKIMKHLLFYFFVYLANGWAIHLFSTTLQKSIESMVKAGEKRNIESYLKNNNYKFDVDSFEISNENISIIFICHICQSVLSCPIHFTDDGKSDDLEDIPNFISEDEGKKRIDLLKSHEFWCPWSMNRIEENSHKILSLLILQSHNSIQSIKFENLRFFDNDLRCVTSSNSEICDILMLKKQMDRYVFEYRRQTIQDNSVRSTMKRSLENEDNRDEERRCKIIKHSFETSTTIRNL
ncbi:hypothetical protein SNEBB_003667 [Seison nebaliae]|nr:hypothetical protein SNEBB_003667 [Seison nebaliae]